MKHVDVIEVRIWGRRAGAVALEPRLGYYAFAFDPSWRRAGIELAPRTMPLDDPRSVFVFPNLSDATFLLKQGKRWELAPAYDLTYAYNPRGEWTYQHLMSVNGKFNGIKRNDLLAEADRFGVRHPHSIVTDIRTALKNWPEAAKEAGLPTSVSDQKASDFQLL